MNKKKAYEELNLEAKTFFNSIKKDVANSIRSGERVVRISFQKISEFSPKLSEQILEAPEESLAIMETALEESGMIGDQKNLRIRLLDLPKQIQVKVRNIRAEHLDKFVWIEGIIRQASDVRPQVVNARFECPSCGAILSVLQIDRKFQEPTKCSCGWKGNFKILSKEMVDTQRLTIEESPDALEGGEQPKRINVFLKEDLVEPKLEEKTTPGTKVKIFGILKEVPVPLQTGAISTRYDIVIEANNIIPLEETFEDLEISEEDVKQILELAADPRVYHRLSESIAPSIFGFEQEKRAILLQTFGGVKKTKSDGGKTRGDIHVLLVGDPGVAKSAMLKFTSTIAPRGRYVSGKSATGAGLTASVVKDEFLKGWALEAGAMVLANKGLVCIDEIEKMDEEDRSTMHEALEQQTVSISKANIHATLRAETTVLAAGNPKLGRFNPATPITQQIDISPALLSRFDVIFVIRDIPNPTQDRAIAAHILQEHKQEVVREVVEARLLRKYLAYAKQKIFPKLTNEAIEEIMDFYIKLRSQSSDSSGDPKISITARQLEGIVRLSEAHARMRLSNEVRRDDARRAIDILKYSLGQVGYDEETQSFDIDKAFGKMSSSQRGKINIVKEVILQLESQLGKLIPVEEIVKALDGKLKENEIEDSLVKLERESIIFKPRKGYIQRL